MTEYDRIKSKKHYLVATWQPNRGSSFESPSCIFYAGIFYSYPLTNVPSHECYSSEKRAERVAEKCRTLYTRAAVIEVPNEAIIPYKRDRATGIYVPMEVN